MDDLKKIDVLKDRFNVSYAVAKEALAQAEGDVVAALVALEKRRQWWRGSREECCQNLWQGMKNVLQEGLSAKIKIKKNDSTVFRIPVTVGALAVLGALSKKDLALVAGIGSFGAMLKGYHLELERKTDKTEDEFIIIS
ncbi:MAG: DUF4342 domain-containing protein [Bacillota bacterium]